MRQGVTRGHVAAAAVALATAGFLLASPELFGERLRAGIDGAARADPAGLWLAALCFAGVVACSGLAWRTVLRGCGATTSGGDACARYATGSLVNSLAPARLGSAVRIALFARTLPEEGRLLAAGGAGAAVGAARAVWTALLVAIAAATGAVPAWPAALGAAAACAAVAAVLVAVRLRRRHGLVHVLDAFRALGRDPLRAGRLVGWTGAAAACRVVAAAAVAQAVGLDQPLLAAVLVVAAVDLAAILPVTPGNLGVAAAAAALVLGSSGVAAAPAIAVGVAFSGVETLTSLTAGCLGLLALADRPGRRALTLATAAAGCALVAGAFGATVVLPVI
jgi:uncharacterized membrane protein YbhN (UPF0104 family)